ncbi:hypothetical protein [Kerstersia gyiorum]|uniref:hypothetical protein n=1 Tax=Kerstersia gyiorum TaxID=206506 RepID=UPI00209D5E27|nr:hypothetical protein [Kerstersia gyiorum]MCP1638280.1 hypothetical protein [Kerstersia gyiorum]MCP1672880.1 hypothetical protein [Kerstersia gyiorum]MCP1710786.1 hypothetical protein [Kerstersia gyiorum]
MKKQNSPTNPTKALDSFFHALDDKVKLKKPLSIEEMNDIAAAGWAGELSPYQVDDSPTKTDTDQS